VPLVCLEQVQFAEAGATAPNTDSVAVTRKINRQARFISIPPSLKRDKLTFGRSAHNGAWLSKWYPKTDFACAPKK
jgi:hypothetical protein